MRRFRISTLFYLVATMTTSYIHNENFSSAMAFTLRIPRKCTGTHVKPNNVCGSCIFHMDRCNTILSAKTSDDGNDKYLGALDLAVQTGNTRKLGKRETFWVERCLELVEYKRKHGNCDVPIQKVRSEARTQLQNWVANQRTQYRYYQQNKNPCSMTKEKIAILENMGFKWEINGWSGDQAGWKVRYEELIEYKGIHGDCNVPGEWKENPKLAKWVYTQRVQYRYLKEGKPSDMTDERIDLLEELDFDWYINGPQVDWELRYEELKQYKDRYGHCNVPRGWKENQQLAIWVMTQRKQYRLLKEGKESLMTDERISMLEKLGFEWYVNVDWEMRYDELRQYKDRCGDCNVPRGWKENPKLAIWVSNQRTHYRLLKEGKPSSMTDERIDLLEKIGFEWVLRGKRKQTK